MFRFFFLVLIFGCQSKNLIKRQSYYVYNENKKYGIKNSSNIISVSPIFDYLSYQKVLDKGYIFYLNQKTGIIDQSGKKLLDTNSGFHLHYSIGNLLLVSDSTRKYGAIDTNFKIIIPLEYRNIYDIGNSLFRLENGSDFNRKYGICDNHFNIILPVEYDDIPYHKMKDSLIPVKKGKWYGYIDIHGNTKIPFKYKSAEYFINGLAYVSDSNYKYGYINKENKIIVPFDYEWQYFGTSHDYFKNSLTVMKRNKKYGMINRSNEIVIPFNYDELENFQKGFAYAKHKTIVKEANYPKEKIQLYGYIDTNGKEYFVKQVNYDSVAWNISDFPMKIPNYCGLLHDFRNLKLESEMQVDGYIVAVIFEPDSFHNKYPFYTEEELNYEVEKTDSFYHILESRKREFSSYDTGYYSALENCRYSSTFFNKKNEEIRYRNKIRLGMPPKYTMEKLFSKFIINFCKTPIHYPNLESIKRNLISDGFNIGRRGLQYELESENKGNFEIFKKETLFKIIEKEEYRILCWEWIKPAIKQALKLMHPFHKKEYLEILTNLRNYISTYNSDIIKHHLEYNYAEFAWQTPEGNYDENRPIYAFIDRLIFIHKLINVNDAKRWIDIVYNDLILA